MCPDTVDFLSMLHHLNDDVDEDADPPELPERQAARSLFRWEVSAISGPLSYIECHPADKAPLQQDSVLPPAACDACAA